MGKGKGHPTTGHEDSEGEHRYSYDLSSALDGGLNRQIHTSADLPPSLARKQRPGTHCPGGWVIISDGLDRCGKSRLQMGFDPRTFQPVASRCTELSRHRKKMVKVKVTIEQATNAQKGS